MNLDPLESLIREAIADGVFPGACFAIGEGYDFECRAVGAATYCPESRPATFDTIWDLASVSKVMGTTTLAMREYEAGRLDLDRPVSHYLPEFGKPNVAVANLLRHDSGLIAFRPYHRTLTEPSQVKDAVLAEGFTYETGTKTVYSDLNMIAMQMILERVSGEPFAPTVRRALQRLGCDEAFYIDRTLEGGDPGDVSRFAPTERVEDWRKALRDRRGTFRDTEFGAGNEAGEFIQGEVHDPTATVLGGVAGHAGLFATIGDVARFAAAMLDFQPAAREVIERFTRRQEEKSSRGLGWDTKSPTGSSAGTKFGPRSYGHTGYTGTSVWIDPDAGRFAVLLGNRVHPTSENTKIIPFRSKFHNLAWDCF